MDTIRLQEQFQNNRIVTDCQEKPSVMVYLPKFYMDEVIDNAERGIVRTATGTGPVEWSHNRQADGIYDLCANVWEWVGGIRLVFGELQLLPDNNSASGRSSQAETSADWRAIDGKSGEWLLPDGNGTTPNSLKLDFADGRWIFVTDTVTSAQDAFRHCDFLNVTAHPCICKRAKELLYATGCLPCFENPNVSGVSFYANNGAAERIPFRGGRWGQGVNSGVFKSCFDDPRTFSGDAVGFRSAYYEMHD